VKFVVAAGPFASALSLATTGVRVRKSGKKPSEMLSAVRLMAADDQVCICCADNHLAITACITAEVIEPGQAAVSDRLAKLVPGFADDAMVTVSTTEHGATVICGNSRSRIAIQPMASLPDVLAIVDEVASIAISGDDCLQLLWPFAAVGTELTRHYLCGVALQSIEGRLVAVATDGARLMKTSISADELSSSRDLIIPSSTIEALRKAWKSGRPAKVTLRRSRSLFSVATPQFSLVSPLIDAGSTGFPAYQHVIPKTLPNTASCDRNELIDSLGRLSATSTAEAPLVALSWRADARGQLDIFLARQPHDGSDAIGAETKGNADIALPPSQLADMVSNFESERIHFETAEGGPLVIRDNGKLALITRAKWIFRKEEHGAEAVA
jgi:DNA polymerase-3 subunit beta